MARRDGGIRSLQMLRRSLVAACLVAGITLLPSCAATYKYNAVAAIDDLDDVFVGSAEFSSDGSAVLTLVSEKSGIRCHGTSVQTYAPPGGGIAGRRGEAFVECDDGRQIQINYVATTRGVGSGEGIDQNGNLVHMKYARSDTAFQTFLAQFRARAATQGAPPPSSVAYSPQRSGTGFRIGQQYVLTNEHVIKECQEIRVVARNRPANAHVVATDPTNDLAVLKTDSSDDDLATFRTGKSVRAGDEVVAMGYPLRGLLASEPIVTVGTISALAGLSDDVRFLQFSAPVQPGNSGGPLLDISGNVVGIVVGKLDVLRVAQVTGDIPQNVNFAINASVARTFLDAHGMDYVTAASKQNLSAADVAERAQQFTVIVECRN
jgi:S1-C subfamily serine protease